MRIPSRVLPFAGIAAAAVCLWLSACSNSWSVSTQCTTAPAATGAPASIGCTTSGNGSATAPAGL